MSDNAPKPQNAPMLDDDGGAKPDAAMVPGSVRSGSATRGPRTPREWAVVGVLLVSLALNFVVLGYWGAQLGGQAVLGGQAAPSDRAQNTGGPDRGVRGDRGDRGAGGLGGADGLGAGRDPGRDSGRDMGRQAGRPRGAGVWRTGVSPQAFIRAVPSDHRDDVVALLKDRSADSRVLRQHLRDAQRAARTAMRADPFDPVAAGEAFAELGAAEMALRDRGRVLILDLLAALPPEARRATLATVLAAPAPEGAPEEIPEQRPAGEL